MTTSESQSPLSSNALPRPAWPMTLLLVAVVVCCSAGLVWAGLQPSVVWFFVSGLSLLAVSVVTFLLCFRRLFDSSRFWPLQAAMMLIAMQVIFLAVEASSRVIRRTQLQAMESDESEGPNSVQSVVDQDESATAEKETAEKNPKFLSGFWDVWQPVLRRDERFGLALIPNSSVTRFDSVIRINSHGTRGPEFALEKQPGELRVLCLGSSTTFGITAEATDRPYPEVLEEILAEKLDRAVTVINAGIPALKVQTHANRLELELLKLNPDVVVFYEGFANIPSGVSGDARFRPRGSWLAQQAMLLQAKRETGVSHYSPWQQAFYRNGLTKIVELCRSNGIKLFLGTFALAYDEDTPAERLDFYAGIMPLVGASTPVWAWECVEINNTILKEVAQAQDVEVIDIAAVLGGKSEHFCDYCHLFQSGKDIMAREFGRAIVEWATEPPAGEPDP